jgi:hypothetical protein
MSRKVFTAGEVLAAADVNSFLMDQTVMSFAGTAARGSAIGTATEGMMTYLNDTDQIEVWSGSAWVRRVPTSIPFAQAVGEGYAGAPVTVVTFPAGRFTVTPAVNLANYENVYPVISARSTASFTYQNAVFASATYTYIATQMTSTSATG